MLEDHENYNKTILFELINIEKTQFYYHVNNPINSWVKNDDKLAQLIIEIFNDHKGNLGSPRMKIELFQKFEIAVSERRIQRIYKKLGLVCSYTKLNKPKPGKSVTKVDLPNLTKGDELNINHYYVDTTYLTKILGVWLYGCFIYHAKSKKIVGYHFSNKRDSNMAVTLLRKSQHLIPTDAIIHSDRGSEFCNELFESELLLNNYIHSYSVPGQPWENMIERWNKTLKIECSIIKEKTNKNFESVETEVRNYIETYYNTNRRTKVLQGKTPNEVFQELAIFL